MAAGRPPRGDAKPKDVSEKLIAENRKARYEYHIDDTLEVGIMLVGTEVKALRAGRIDLKDAFAQVERGQLYLLSADIQVYAHGNIHTHEPKRRRKLLAHRKEIDKLEGRVKEKGYTIVALKIYWKGGKAKVLVGLAKGKKQHDRRESIREREDQRDLDRAKRRAR